ncbi:282e2fd0-023c-44e2-abf5-43e582978cc6 [Sclerotinia trifoliorum]|uniref:282e2fd0-023c-44e2-abf5-43e582978cc6 n=1 Tax=Sclerotinia trifoliorum TaxID=28548 RepID=A0A8H2ZP88_9HELO|nr:282e2fd0-023c-44e2-abf5-43e582978cc6 [Sclerotinia trifoliorum]
MADSPSSSSARPVLSDTVAPGYVDNASLPEFPAPPATNIQDERTPELPMDATDKEKSRNQIVVILQACILAKDGIMNTRFQTIQNSRCSTDNQTIKTPRLNSSVPPVASKNRMFNKRPFFCTVAYIVALISKLVLLSPYTLSTCCANTDCLAFIVKESYPSKESPLYQITVRYSDMLMRLPVLLLLQRHKTSLITHSESPTHMQTTNIIRVMNL